MNLDIEGRVAFVCASTTGLGLASAKALAAEGAAIAITGRRGDVAEEQAASIAAEFGVASLGIGVDLLDPQSRQEALEAAEKILGPIDILVLNGPGPRPGGALSVGVGEATEAALSLIEPHVDLVSRVLPSMRSRGWGRIVAVGAYSMDSASTWLALSAIGRAGLARYLQALAKEVAAEGVTVNIVQPGIIATARIDALDAAEVATSGGTPAQARARREASMPMGRLGEPEEFAAAVAFFASEPARYITGQSLMVDGGLYAAD